MSLLMKLVLATASLKVKTMVSAPVKFCVVLPLARVTATVGAVVSVLYWKTTRLFDSVVAPLTPLRYVSRLRLAPASLNLPLATPTLAEPTALAVGVKVAL